MVLSRNALWVLCLSSLVAGANAQTSRITSVTVYPGSATVERTLTLPAGARQAVYACLPAEIDPQSIQVHAATNISVGEVAVRKQARALTSDCVFPGQERLIALEDQLAALEAEEQGLQKVDTWLDRFQPNNPGQIAATSEALRKAGQSAALRKHAIAREKEKLQRQLQPLQAELERIAGASPEASTVQITLDAPIGGSLVLSYQIRNAGWQPGYHASLNAQTQRVVLERTAQVAQNTGEDWRNAPLTLSTGQPNRATSSPFPSPWRLSLTDPKAQALQSAASDHAYARSAKMEVAAMAAPAPINFEATVAEDTFATSFKLPQPVSVPSKGELLTFKLDQHTLPAQLLVRTTPALNPAAFLVATFTMPEGVWPSGPIRLYRDGAYTGAGQFNAQSVALVGLSFGQDDRVQVRTLPSDNASGKSGFLGSQQQRTDRSAWQVHNLHSTPIELQVLDSAPVAENSDIRISSNYKPQPSQTDWNQQNGTIAWNVTLPAGGKQTFSSEHTISWPESMHLNERRY